MHFILCWQGISPYHVVFFPGIGKSECFLLSFPKFWIRQKPLISSLGTYGTHTNIHTHMLITMWDYWLFLSTHIKLIWYWWSLSTSVISSSTFRPPPPPSSLEKLVSPLFHHTICPQKNSFCKVSFYLLQFFFDVLMFLLLIFQFLPPLLVSLSVW